MKQGMKFLNAVICAVLLAACTANDDLYDPAKAEALLKAQYEENFVKGFGEVSPDYSWDATSACPKYGAVTRAEGDYTPTLGDFYEIPSETLGWLRSQLPEKRNNRQKGTPFLMTVPNNEFTIIPIYQGDGALDWELHMVAGGEDVMLWKKYDGIQVNRDGDWEELSKQSWPRKRHTEDDENVQGRRYTLNLADAIGKPMYFYLEITSFGFGVYNPRGTKLSSLDHMMLALDCPCPGQEFEGKEVLVVGCEDNKGKDGLFLDIDSDWDMNDLVFMIVGDKIPDPIDVQPGEFEEIITKRYMMEDLGSTCDRDFNDIVVDVTQKRIISIKNGVIDESSDSLYQEAVIRHLGGVLSFRLKIGDEDLGEMEGKLGANPDTTISVSGWIPEENNISLKVKTEESFGITQILFPENGDKAPMIIAVDPDVQWMEERESITKEWFESVRKN